MLQFMGSQRVRHGLVTEQKAISSLPWDPSVCDEAGRKRLSQKKRPDEPRDRKSSIKVKKETPHVLLPPRILLTGIHLG